MKLSEVKVEPFEDNWKDWFIVDDPEEKISLSVFLDKTYHFYVNLNIQRFKFTGTIIDAYKYCSKLYYKFNDQKSQVIKNSIFYSMVVDKDKTIGECIITR